MNDKPPYDGHNRRPGKTKKRARHRRLRRLDHFGLRFLLYLLTRQEIAA